MITLFELKNKGFCRCFIRTPFYIKNFFLLVWLTLILGFIHIMYFRRDGMSIQNITKVLKGLNSNTFNYLGAHSDSLRLTKLLNNYQAQISSNQFMDDCLRINKPCKFEQLARNWHAFENWQFGEDGYDYLLEKFGDQQVSVYVDIDDEEEDWFGDSFQYNKMHLMKYEDFLKKMSNHAQGVTLKEGDSRTFDKLRDDVNNPSFLQDITEFYKLEILQGQTFKVAPHYEKEEQLLCSIDGLITIKLIPHIFRQEVYTGKPLIITDHESQDTPPPQYKQTTSQTCSPVNFFDPDYLQYPIFEDVDRKYTVLLHEGDCLYIPAYYFFQYLAKPENQPEQKGLKPSAIAVSLKYHGNSALLDAFYKAIETEVLT